MTLDQCMAYINSELNYPSISYADVAVYFDQAIAELNTSLHINIPPISKLVAENKFVWSADKNLLIISSTEAESLIPVYQTSDEAMGNGDKFYYDRDIQAFGVLVDDVFVYSTTLQAGVVDSVNGTITVYSAAHIGVDQYIWGLDPINNPTSVDLENYLPDSWVLLFLIPYVCFKQSVKDGDTGALYVDAFSEGFKQLQNSYNVPSTIELDKVIGNPAYAKEIVNALEAGKDTSFKINVKAITLDMQHPKVTIVESSDDFFSGGF